MPGSSSIDEFIISFFRFKVSFQRSRVIRYDSQNKDGINNEFSSRWFGEGIFFIECYLLISHHSCNIYPITHMQYLITHILYLMQKSGYSGS